MAVTFSDINNTVFGDQRVYTALVNMDDGPQSFAAGSFTKINGFVVNAQSTAVASWSKIATLGTTRGYLSIASCATGNTFRIMVIGK